MNRIKSVFISIYPVVTTGILGYSAWMLFASGQYLLWAGPLLTVVPFMLFLGRAMLLRNLARTSASFPALNALAVAGVGLSAFQVIGRNGDQSALLLAAVGAATFLVYSVWYSNLGRTASGKLAVGKKLPDLEFLAADGKPIHVHDFLGAPALIFFYRGNWCPLCMAQVKEVAARYREISKLGARVALISPQPHDNTRELAQRFGVPFDFLTDVGNRAARALDIEMRNGLPIGFGLLGYENDTVFPTVMVLDAQGVIRWVDQTDNYRVRPEPETFLPVLRSLVGAPEKPVAVAST